MYLLGALGVVYGLLILIGLPILLFGYPAMKRRLAELEAEVRRLRAQGIAPMPEAVQATPATQTEDISDYLRATGAEAEPPPEAPIRAVPPPLPEAPTPAPVEPTPSGAYVLTAENADRFGKWLRENWTLAIAAVSLVLGGLFMVQYGVERGLLTPTMRVIGALGLGAALIAGGEVLRRRYGDVSNASLKHLPSTLSGAGAVIAFIAMLSAHALYGMIGPFTTLAALALISLGTVALGWFYGPVLSAVGLIGAGVAPFLLQGGTEGGNLLYGYFALVALAGLAIDSFRHWAWVSALALAVAAIGLWLLWQGAPFAPGLAGAALVLAFGAITLPERRLTPLHAGTSFLPLTTGATRPEFPTLIAAAGGILATGAALMIALGAHDMAEAVLGFGLIVVLFAAAALWLARAPALELLGAVPAGAFLIALVFEALNGGPLMQSLWAALGADPEDTRPTTVWWLAGAGALMSLIAFARLRFGLSVRVRGADDLPGGEGLADLLLWSFGTALIGPATLLILEFLWHPSAVLGNWPWALCAMAMAALMVVLTERRARIAAGQTARDMGLMAAAAVILIALAFFLILTKAALTLALALLIVLAVVFDRRFPMPPMGWVAQLGAAVIGYRLLVDPGLDWSVHHAGWGAFLLSHLAPIAAFEATRRYARPERAALRAVAESALMTTCALFVMLTIARLVGDDDTFSHWFAGLSAAIWLGSALGQIWRMPTSGRMTQILRGVFATLSGLAALGALAVLGITLSDMLDWGGERVLGPPLLDSLALAFLPLAATLAAGAFFVGAPGRPLARVLKPALIAVAGIVTFVWGWLEIRRLWRGPDLSVYGPSDGELYSYTVALLAASLGLLALAFWRRSLLIRRIAMAGVALTIAKVFLIDMSGLSGLTRVVSFIGLGLALTGLAWLNRQIDARWSAGAPPPPLPPEG